MNKLLRISERNKFEMIDLLPDDDCINKLALYFQNFSDQTRIKILSALAIKDLCVNDLAKILGINQTTISHQLKILKDQEVVDFRREGKVLIYRLKSQVVNEMMMYAVKNLTWNLVFGASAPKSSSNSQVFNLLATKRSVTICILTKLADASVRSVAWLFLDPKSLKTFGTLV